jgi:hypothetical protein
MVLAVLLNIASQFLQVCARVIPGALILPIPKRPLDRVGPGTIGREKQQLYTGRPGQPLPHCFGFMAIAMIHDDGQAPILGGGIALLKEGE